MNPYRSQREELYAPLMKSIKLYLPTSQSALIKEHDEALFGVPSEVLDNYYLDALDQYIYLMGTHMNKIWAPKLKDHSAVEMFYDAELGDEFDADFLALATDLVNKLEDMFERLTDGCNLSELREELECDLNALEKHFERFKDTIEESSPEEVKRFARIVNNYLHGGETDGLSFIPKAFRKVDKVLPSFGEAGDPQFMKFAQFKHEIYMLDDTIKGVLDYKTGFHFDLEKWLALIEYEE